MFSRLAIATAIVIASLSSAMAASTATKVYVNASTSAPIPIRWSGRSSPRTRLRVSDKVNPPELLPELGAADPRSAAFFFVADGNGNVRSLLDGRAL